MKTFIIQLERHDDIVSARDKMGWAKGGRILLVWPEFGRSLNRRLDLRLLQRASAELGAQLALVSRDPEVHYQAPRLGIPVFKSLRKAQSEPWRLPRRFRGAATAETQSSGASPEIPDVSADPTQEAPSPANEIHLSAAERLRAARPIFFEPTLTPLTRLVYFGLGVLALLSIAAVLIPSAEIRITPQTQVQDVVMEVWTGPAISQVDISGALPSYWVTIAVEGRQTIPASGEMQVAQRAAEGRALFTNLTDHEVIIPAETIALTLGDNRVRFAVAQEGLLPPGPGTTLTLPIRALNPGAEGNLPAGSLVAIEGLLGVQASVTNPQPTHSGVSRPAPAPTAADRQTLSRQLHASLEKSAREELQLKIAPGDMPILTSMETAEIVEESFQPAEGLPADQLSLILRMEYRVRIVSTADLQALAGMVFDANLAPGFTPVSGPAPVEMVGSPQIETGASLDETRYRWTIHAHRRVMAQIPETQAVRLALGRSPRTARQTLESQLRLETPASITLQPAWWPLLPVLPFRVQVIPQD